MGLPAKQVEAVLDDWRSAPVDARVRAALQYLEKLTLSPQELNVGDIHVLHDAGVMDEAIQEIAYVCFLFSVMVRLADAFDFDIPTARQTKASGQFLFKHGYKMAKLIR